MGESAAVSTLALTLLESKAHTRRSTRLGGAGLVTSSGAFFGFCRSVAAITSDLLLLTALLAASGLVGKSLSSIELLFTSAEHPLSGAVL